MDIKRMRFVEDNEPLSSKLFWNFDYTIEVRNRNSALCLQSLSILDEMMGGDNVDMLPDPISNIIGVIFDKTEADTCERNHSPSSYSRSRGGRGDDTDRELNTPRNIGNLTGRDTSGENLNLRNKDLSASGYSKDKNKSTLASITNKYTKLKGSYSSFIPIP
jgi:hypothetical protein